MKHPPLLLSPDFARRIDNGVYWLFDMECPQPVMAAYERLWATRGASQRAQQDGDLLIGWVVERTLAQGDFELAMQLRDALEKLGWRPSP